MSERLQLVPVTLEEANAFVVRCHRHPQARTWREVLHPTIAIPQISPTRGRPVSRMADDGWTLEVNRTCTDGTPNANSLLYGAARRAAWALGYKRLITYTLPEESGASLRAAGFRNLGEAGGGPWSRESRPRIDTHPQQKKIKWEAVSA
jgi:hypothetical protein